MAKAARKVHLEYEAPENYVSTLSLLAKQQLGDSKPSEFLAELLKIADPYGVKNSIVVNDVRAFWLMALPSAWLPKLMVVRDLGEAAQMADGLFKNLPKPSKSTALDQKLAKLEERLDKMCLGKPEDGAEAGGRNKKLTQPGLCYYHEKFGKDSTRCKANCSYWAKFQGKQSERPNLSSDDEDVPMVLTLFYTPKPRAANAIFDPLTKYSFRIVTGSSLSVLPHKLFPHRKQEKPDFELTTVAGTKLDIFGVETLTMSFGMDQEFTWNFVVASTVVPIIGMDFIGHYGFSVGFNDDGKIVLSKEKRLKK